MAAPQPRVLTVAAIIAAAASLAGSAATAAPLSYTYSLQPRSGELDFSIDSTALNTQGFGTADPAVGLLGWTLRIGGRVFQATNDPLYPTYPVVTLTNSALSFANFAPVTGGVSYNFTATAPGAPGSTFSFVFTGSDGTSLSGSGSPVAAVPEPASTGLVAAGLFGFFLVRWRASSSL
jgi:hypothetical protein